MIAIAQSKTADPGASTKSVYPAQLTRATLSSRSSLVSIATSGVADHDLLASFEPRRSRARRCASSRKGLSACTPGGENELQPHRSSTPSAATVSTRAPAKRHTEHRPTSLPLLLGTPPLARPDRGFHQPPTRIVHSPSPPVETGPCPFARALPRIDLPPQTSRVQRTDAPPANTLPT